MYRLLLIILSTFLLSASETGSVFEYGNSAKEVALGGASVSLPIMGFNALNNPAFLAEIVDIEYGLSYFSMSQERSLNIFSYSRKISPNAGIGISLFMASVDGIEQTNIDNDIIGNLDYLEGFGSMSFAVSLGKFASGANLKIFQNSLHNIKVQAVGLDLGLNYRFSEKINLSFTSKNIGAEYKWSSTYSEKLKNPSALGFSYNDPDRLNYSFQINMNALEYENVNIGIEYRIEVENKENIFFRLGLSGEGLEGKSKGYYVGFSTPLKLTEKLNLTFDYAFDIGSQSEGPSHLFTFSTLVLR